MKRTIVAVISALSLAACQSSAPTNWYEAGYNWAVQDWNSGDQATPIGYTYTDYCTWRATRTSPYGTMPAVTPEPANGNDEDEWVKGCVAGFASVTRSTGAGVTPQNTTPEAAAPPQTSPSPVPDTAAPAETQQTQPSPTATPSPTYQWSLYFWDPVNQQWVMPSTGGFSTSNYNTIPSTWIEAVQIIASMPIESQSFSLTFTDASGRIVYKTTATADFNNDTTAYIKVGRHADNATSVNIVPVSG